MMVLSFQDMILKLQEFWAERGCALLQPYDVEMGAGTFHPATVLRALDPKPWACAYVQPSRRPTDGRYGDNPNRLQHYYQFQILIKPNPSNIIDWYFESLRFIGIDPQKHDLRLVEDDWESPTLGASGLGWEIWLDGMEVTQFTYFQQVAGISLNQTPVEITYGLERLAMYIQGVDNVYDLAFNRPSSPIPLTYGDVFQRQEQQFSTFNFEAADTAYLFAEFQRLEGLHQALLDHKSLTYPVILPSYDYAIKASHIFNLLDARSAISVAERQAYITRVRGMVRKTCEAYVQLCS